MSDQVILQTLGDPDEGERILDEFERLTGLEPDVRDDGRYYDLEGDDHQTQIVRTLTDIDEHWTDHIGLKLPG